MFRDAHLPTTNTSTYAFADHHLPTSTEILQTLSICTGSLNTDMAYANKACAIVFDNTSLPTIKRFLLSSTQSTNDTIYQVSAINQFDPPPQWAVVLDLSIIPSVNILRVVQCISSARAKENARFCLVMDIHLDFAQEINLDLVFTAEGTSCIDQQKVTFIFEILQMHLA
jgi:hypothetical protein